MRCSRCATENRDGASFCRECGTHLDPRCPGCGSLIARESKFCDACGTALGGALASVHLGPPESYTPKHLAEKILTLQSALEGERKQVTVLFADVTGFTALSEQMDPEDVHAMMARVLRLMLGEVHRYEGTVNQFLGDGIMALFGAPIAHEDHAQRALHAALGIRKALEQDRSRLHPRAVTLQVRQGLNTGLVVVGSIGSDLRMDYTAVGDTTNVAARLQQAATPGQVLVSEATHQLIADYFETGALGEVPVKGKTAPIRVWEVIAPRTARTRLEVEAAHGFTPFVGRERELGTLLESFESAAAGRGRIGFVIGDPGIGKSRLLLEFQRRLGDRATWLEGRALPFGDAMVFHPLIQALKRAFRIDEHDVEAVVAQKIEDSVARLGDDLRPGLPYLKSLLSVDPGDPAVLKMDPRRRRSEIFEALRQLTLRAAERRPQVLVLEDAQWMDRATEDYVRFIADSVPTSRLLLLLPYRTGYTPPFGERTYHVHVPLSALPPVESVRMARAMLGASELPGEVESLLLDKAEGNPFFLEEIVRTLQDTGALRHVDDRYVLTRPPAEIAVRSTIQDFIMARIDRLGEGPKRVLQLASVVGREFPRRLLDRIAEPAGQTTEALEQLKAVELIHEKSIHGEVAFVFKHALTQETAYESILLHRRKELHARIGLALEELYAGRLAERYGVLAYHFSRAERPAKALEYLLKAADRAAGAYANNEARALYEQALPLIDAGDRPVRAEIFRKLATVTQYIGDPDASLHYAESALELFEELVDKRGAVAMHLHIHALYTWQWDGAREDFGLKHLEAAAALVERDPDSVEKGLVFQRTGHLYLHRCQPATTLEWAQRAVDMFARLGVPMGTSLGTALTYTGRIDEGIGYAEPNWEPVLKAAIPMVMAVMGHELCLALALARDVPRAAEWGERVLPHVLKTSPVFEGMLQRPLTFVYTLAGDVARAREACAAVERSEGRSMLGCIYEDGAAVGFHHLRCGRWDQAKSYLERRLPLYEERNHRAAFAACALVLGQLRLELEDFAGAEALLSRALAVAREGGNVLLELWALPVLGELHLRAGHPEGVEPVLQRGFALLEPGRRWYGLPGPLFLVKGMLAGAERRWKDAAAAFDEAVALARRHHLPWDEARALYERALMHVAQGGADDRAEAGRLLGTSLELFQRVGAVKDAEKVSTRKEMLNA